MISTKIRPDLTNKCSYDNRQVIFETLHNIQKIDFDTFLEPIKNYRSRKILDAGAGYGAITREILERYDHKNLEITLVDSSPQQLRRAKNELLNKDKHEAKLSFIHGDILETNFQKSSFDVVCAKMLLHEIPKAQQLDATKVFYDITKEKGIFLVWDVTLKKSSQEIIQRIIHRKDELAGYDDLCEKRYFFTESELTDNLMFTGFKEIKKLKEISYRFETLPRLDSEFQGNINKLKALNKFILQTLGNAGNEIKDDLSLEYNENNVCLTISKSLFLAIK